MAKAMILRPLPLGTLSGTAPASGYTRENAGSDRMGLVFQTAAITSGNLELDLGADTAVDSAVLLGMTGAQQAWQLRVRAATAAQGNSFPGGSYDSGNFTLLAGTNAPASGRGVGLWFPSLASVPPLSRYLRFTVSSIATAPFTLARLVIGTRIVLDRNFQFGRAHGVRDLGAADFSRRGVLLAKRGKKLRSLGLTFASIHKDEVENMIDPLLAAIGGSDPIAIVTDTDADANRQRRIWYGPLSGDVGTVERAADRWQSTFNLVHLD